MDLDMPSEAIKKKWTKEQDQLKKNLITENKFDFIVDENNKWKNLTLIGGVDISFVKNDPEMAISSLAVLSFPDLKVVYTKMKKIKLTKPYISGFLAFREVDHLIELIDDVKLNSPQFLPQVILVDGSGIFHHRGFGLASHLGVLVDIPTIGIAKNLLCIDGITNENIKPRQEKELTKAGDAIIITGVSGNVLGAALRGTDSSKTPVYISLGHRITLDTSLELVQQTFKFKIPEPIRQADLLSRVEAKKLE